MSNDKKCSQYLYLLQEREFIKTKENVYKVGRTEKENHSRFNQYPKGSVLLFQMICNNCKSIERQIINLFKEKFIQRKDIGNEYFEGDFQLMIDIIYSTIRNETKITDISSSDDVKNSENMQTEYTITDLSSSNDEKNSENMEETPFYQLTTYEEWSKLNDITVIITTKGGDGFLRFNNQNQLWREIYNKNSLDFNNTNMEDLLGYIDKTQDNISVRMVKPKNVLMSESEMWDIIYNYKNKTTSEIITTEQFRQLNDIERDNYTYLSTEDEYTFVGVDYNINQIFQDTIKKCYVKNYDYYNLNYHEYVLHIATKNYTSSECVIFDCLTFTYTPVEMLINKKILTEKECGSRIVIVKNVVNIDFVDNILNSLITPEIKHQYKKLVYNLIVKQEEPQIIFYDYNNCLLTTWIKDILYTISIDKFYIYSSQYYSDKLEFKKLLKIQKLRCVIIDKYEKIPIKTQIKDFSKLGFKNIIVRQNDKTNTMYNISNFKKYLIDNKELLIKCIKEQNNYEPTHWESEIAINDSIFYMTNLLLTNFLKWCCT
jgi:hypothetical protein